MIEKIQQIIDILERGTSLPSGENFDCGMKNGNVSNLCYDEISENGKTCMLKCRNLAIIQLQQLVKKG